MGIVVIGVVAYLFDLLMRWVERALVPWKGRMYGMACWPRDGPPADASRQHRRKAVMRPEMKGGSRGPRQPPVTCGFTGCPFPRTAV
jgi:hypothetical protein